MEMCRERAELRGTILDGRYRMGSTIGRGATGVCMEAERLATLERVVIKMLRPNFASTPDLASRLRREFEVAHHVFHPGIVPVIDQGTLYDGSPYIVMKYLPSESLNSLLRRCGVLSCQQLAVIVARVCSILHSVHRRGYVHRDVKPEHILLNRGALGELEVHLLDFGVCAAETAPTAEKSRERGRVYGTPSYSSPEQAAGNPYVDARADLFGLGVLMFEALSGRLPFPGSDVNAVLRRIISEDAPRVAPLAPQVDPDMDALIAKLMSRHRDARYTSARALARALGPWLQDRLQTERQLAAALNVEQQVVSMSMSSRQALVA
jgi:serine/threonine-protein kinase